MEGFGGDAILVIAVMTVTLLLVFVACAAVEKRRRRQEMAVIEEDSDDSTNRIGRGVHNGECPICLSTMQIPVQTNCGHWFCACCILDYYDGLGRTQVKCPICRQEVTMLHGAGAGGDHRHTPLHEATGAAVSDSDPLTERPTTGASGHDDGRGGGGGGTGGGGATNEGGGIGSTSEAEASVGLEGVGA
ncbi:unnamed protein product, partial [Discosporangium mesarthrocarpum]